MSSISDQATLQKLMTFIQGSLNTIVEIERENANYRRMIRVLQGREPEQREKRRLITWIAHSDPGFIEGMQQIAPSLLLDLQSIIQTGGEVMDNLSKREPDLVILGDEFDDIPADFVYDTVRSQSPRCAVLRVWGWPVGQRLGVLEGPHEEARIERPMESGHDLVALIDEVRQRFEDMELRAEFGRAFRDRHLNFLRSYKEVSALLEGLSSRR